MVLDQILLSVPCPIFWKNLHGIFLGSNKLFLEVCRFQDYSQLVGKSDAELFWKEYKDEYYKDDQYVITTGKSIKRLENIPLHGRIIISETTKTPLIQNNKIIGVLGVCLDITDRKEKELLQLENERHKTKLKEQEKFRKIIGQIVHDIQSPLSSLQTIVQSAINIPENDRVTLRGIVMSITDITTYMLNKYQDKLNPESEQKQPLLLSANLLQVLSEKRCEYKDVAVNFTHDFEDNYYFTFIKIEPSSFKRMLSNVINNAVDSIKNKKDGIVNVKLRITNEWVVISIEDNGKGMSKEILDKINNGVEITDKKNGHGIGLTQIRDTLQNNYGKLVIRSTLGTGTELRLKFPKILAPTWIAQEIKLFKDDIIVILDDENSIHAAWDTILVNIITKSSNIQVKHFLDGMEAIKFINNFSKIDKQKICLLSDYELLKQSINGLDVIKQTQIKRSTLVTSYYMNPKVRRDANKNYIKILPKSLVFAIPIYINKPIIPQSRKVDMIWVDDAKELIDSFIENHYKHLVVDKYYDPLFFMDNYLQYPLNTKIILDMLYYDDITFIKDGLTIAKELHENGYTNLFMTTAEIIPQDKIPTYLTVILKNDSENMVRLDKLKK